MKHLWDEYNKSLESPDLFLDFGYYSLISSALGRKVWIGDPANKLFLNTYTIFVASAGSGKSAVIKRVRDICFRIGRDGSINTDDEISKFPDIKQLAIPVGPDNTSKSKLVQIMSELGLTIEYEGRIYYHSSVSLALSEFSTLFPSGMDPKDVIRFLTTIYDCEPYQAATISRNSETINNGWLNILAGTQPAFMYHCLDSQALSEGLGARTWFLYAAGPRRRRWNGPLLTQSQLDAKHELVKFIKQITDLVGPINYTPGALALLMDWYENRFDSERKNKSPKLNDYYERKRVHVQKLAAIIAISRNGELKTPIGVRDVEFAFAELARIEAQMDIALTTRPRNEIFPLHQVVEELLSHQDMSLEDIFKDVMAHASIREFVEVISGLVKMKRVRFIRVDGKVLVTIKPTDNYLNLLVVSQCLKDFGSV